MRCALPVLAAVVFVTAPLAYSGAQSAPAQSRQPAADSGVSAATLEAYAKAHLAITALRDREQAELADPRNKKADAQTTLREKYRAERAAALVAQALSAEQFTRLTQQISTNDALRARFEATLARLKPTG